MPSADRQGPPSRPWAAAGQALGARGTPAPGKSLREISAFRPALGLGFGSGLTEKGVLGDAAPHSTRPALGLGLSADVRSVCAAPACWSATFYLSWAAGTTDRAL